jgi:hypothetical protein
MTEELRDDHYQHLLNNAFELKNRLTKESNEAALSIYEDVLRQEFLNVTYLLYVKMRFRDLSSRSISL